MALDSTKVLLVEDDEVMSTYVVKTLARLNINDVQVCVDGNSALKAMAGFVPDVVLTDVHMRPVNGIEFVQKLRASADSRLRSTPVIFMSGDSSRETLGNTMALDSVAYIVKPPRLEVLRAKLEQALQSRF